jgi:RNA polymerase sigma-70 factor (ECF subfamily)
VTGGQRSDDLDEWVLATAPRAVAYARSLLHNPDDADDVVQDCYCRLLTKADVYDLPRDGLKLLLKAVTNACINLRTRRRPLVRLIRAEQADDPPDGRALAPEQFLAHKELGEAVAAGLRKLPQQQRAALELKSLGHSLQEFADILDVTPTNPRFRQVELELDPETKVIRSAVLRREVNGETVGTLTFTLVETANLPDDRYDLRGHLDSDAEFLDCKPNGKAPGPPQLEQRRARLRDEFLKRMQGRFKG